jgi:hypothetical protein
VYVTGFKESFLFDDECIVLKYSADGVFQWDDSYGEMPAGWNYNRNEGKVIKISAAGSIIVGGNSRINGMNFNSGPITVQESLSGIF